MQGKKVEIYILTGFLGSGKSTLLSQLLHYENEKGRQVGVLMNELGNMSIDSSIVPLNTPLIELLNGCICCTIQGELSLQLRTLLEEHDLDAIYIEATGAAHPIDVIDACTHPELAHKIDLCGVITIVNAIQWKEGKMSIKVRKLLKNQVKYASFLLVNRTDSLNEKDLAIVIDEIKEHNQIAELIYTTYSQIDPMLLHTSLRNYQLNNRDALDKNSIEHPHNAHVHDHLHLSTFTFTLTDSIDRITFLTWLKGITGQVYRAKGFIRFTETPSLFLFNYSYGEPMFEKYRGERSVQPVIVIIGEGLNHDEMNYGLTQLRLL